MSSTAPFNEKLWFAIAEPSRRKLIEVLLLKGEATTSRLADDVPFSRQAVSKHIAVLKRAGLVKERKTGKETLFHLFSLTDGLTTNFASEPFFVPLILKGLLADWEALMERWNTSQDALSVLSEQKEWWQDFMADVRHQQVVEVS